MSHATNNHVKITGLTGDQRAALAWALQEGRTSHQDYTLTRSTVVFHADAPSVLLLLRRAIEGTPGRGAPRQPLNSVARKVARGMVRGPDDE